MKTTTRPVTAAGRWKTTAGFDIEVPDDRSTQATAIRFMCASLTLDLEQIAEQGVVGGQRFVIKTTPDIRGVTLDRPGTVFDGVGWVKVGKSCRSCD